MKCVNFYVVVIFSGIIVINPQIIYFFHSRNAGPINVLITGQLLQLVAVDNCERLLAAVECGMLEDVC